MRRALAGSTVVITGASSGIGVAAARAFAKAAANIVLVARSDDVLGELATECNGYGVRALVAAADVGDAEAMRRVADEAAALTGRIDVWINNAGIGAVGRFPETPIEAHERVIRTNLLGALHGAHAVLPFFERQPSGGVLITTNSFGGWVPAPFAAAYSASKFGLRGLSDSLRAEYVDRPQIRICDVFPSFVDTPGVQHAANYTGRALKPPLPLTLPERVAEAMIRLARDPRDAVTIGWVATGARLGYALLPGFGRWAGKRFIGGALPHADEASRQDGSLFDAGYGGSTRGGWTQPGWREAAAASLGTVSLAVAALIARRLSSGD